jgi:hypothetical protein
MMPRSMSEITGISGSGISPSQDHTSPTDGRVAVLAAGVAG